VADPNPASLIQITDICLSSLTDTIGEGTLLCGKKEEEGMRIFRDHLAELPLFSEASRSELVVIRRHLTPLRVSAGRVLVREGARGEQFMVIAEGGATVTRGGSTIATLERGDLVGEMALLDEIGDRRRNATVTVNADGMLFAGSRTEFRNILEAAPSVARRVRETAAQRASSLVA
jgi:CRP-like cAMP-binding protein